MANRQTRKLPFVTCDSQGVAWPEGVDRVRAVERVFPDERDAIVVVCMSRLVYRKGEGL